METRIGTALVARGDGRVAGADAATEALSELGVQRVDFCQVFCAESYEYERVIAGIRSVVGDDAALIGCSTGDAFTAGAVDDGAVAVGLVASDSLRFFTGMGRGLGENVTGAVREAVADLPSTVEGYPYKAAINLHDGLGNVGEHLALATQQKLGPEVPIAGGAAADDHNLEATHVFCGDAVAEDAVAIALVAATERPVVAVEHGHEPLSEPVTVTDADGSLVRELDGRPAYEVWKDAVRERVREEFGVRVDDLDAGDRTLQRVMCEFEFGIDQGDRFKMRWPWIESDTGDALHFSVDVPEGAVLRVTHGRERAQIDSARAAARQALSKAGDTDVAGAFVYDCACRGIVLGDEFSTAVDAMADELEVPFVGFETYGELCMGPGAFSGFHNTTTVVLLLPR